MSYHNSLFKILIVAIENRLEKYDPSANTFLVIYFCKANNTYLVNYHSYKNLQSILNSYSRLDDFYAN